LASVMGETQPIGATEATGNMVQDAAKKRTVKVDLASVLSEEAPDATAPVVLPKPGGGAPAAAQTRDSNLPRTIRLKRPGAAAPAGGGTGPTIAMEPDEGVEHSKSETARIDLPPDAAHPPTRQKTIRIKRPGGAAPGRQLTIARATGATDQPDEAREAPLDIPAFKRPGARVAPSRFDGLFGGLALVATLAACVVIYVLAAQLKSVALGEEQTPSWPFVGQVQ
ncbi:MAG: hypothetical protein K9N49_07580, partial [Candidatus Marinimicrobia bacterium]|nr:hypothetical protein [Candidatus Neomarinimicrobiota bacterium]